MNGMDLAFYRGKRVFITGHLRGPGGQCVGGVYTYGPPLHQLILSGKFAGTQYKVK